MDSKISDFKPVQTVLATDIIPIVSNGNNNIVSAGVFSLNLPNVGNKGITKNTVVSVAQGAIPLTASVILLTNSSSSYSIGSGADGQQLTIVSAGSNYLSGNISVYTAAMFSLKGSVELIYISALNSWIVKSSLGVTFS